MWGDAWTVLPAPHCHRILMDMTELGLSLCTGCICPQFYACFYGCCHAAHELEICAGWREGAVQLCLATQRHTGHPVLWACCMRAGVVHSKASHDSAAGPPPICPLVSSGSRSGEAWGMMGNCNDGPGAGKINLATSLPGWVPEHLALDRLSTQGCAFHG